MFWLRGELDLRIRHVQVQVRFYFGGMQEEGYGKERTKACASCVNARGPAQHQNFLLQRQLLYAG